MWKIFVMLHFYCRYFTVTFTVAVAVLLPKTHRFFSQLALNFPAVCLNSNPCIMAVLYIM